MEVEVNDAVSAINTLVSSLNTLKSSLNNTINSTKNNKLKENITDATSNANTLKKALGFGMIYAGLRSAASFIGDIAKANIDMIETNNLFEVSMGKVVDEYGNLDTKASEYYTKAMNFQNEMNEKLATNKSELQQYQAMYYSMFKGQGINKDASYLMSESLTKAGYDIASLYNLSVNDAMEKIKSGIAGQVESLRTIGIDVSESSLSTVLNEVGIDRTVQELSYAEKEVARYIAIIEQAGQAQGDFAKTFESPANQIRVFQNQLIELKQVAGSFIINAFGGIIVWANAIIMAIKEIIKSIASLFGYDLSSGGSSNLADNIGVPELNTGLSGATKKAKELKKQLMGFDEINNIDKPSSSSGGSGGTGGVATGIDDKLLNSLKEWDNKMSSISGKAQEYRDKILEALGFTRNANGELDWSWKNMNNILKVLTVIAGIVGGILIIGKLTKLVNWLKTLFNILKTGKGATTTFGLGLQTIGKIINGLKSGFTNLGSWVSMVVGQYKIFRTQGNGVISSLKLTKTELAKTGQGFLSLIPTWAKVGVGVAGLVGSTALAYKSMEDLKNGSISTTEGVLKLSGSLAGAAASGAILGSVIPGVGTAVGALAGLTVGATAAIIGLGNSQSDLRESLSNTSEKLKEQREKIEEITSSYNESIESINKNKEASLLELEVVDRQSQSLEGLIDANGKVKAGYEERVKIILNDLNNALGTEYELTGNQITQNGKLYKSYDDLKGNIDEYIEKKKEQIEAEAYEDIYREKIKKRIQLEEELKTASENRIQAEKEYKQALEETTTASGFWEKSQANRNKISASLNLQNAREQEQKLQDELNETIDDLDETEKKYEETYSSINTTVETEGNRTVKLAQNILKGQNEAVETNTPILENRFKTLATKSKEGFNNNLSSLDTDTSNKVESVIDKINEKQGIANQAGSGLARAVETGVNTIDTTEAGKQAVNGVAEGIKANKNNKNLLQAISGVVSNVTGWFKELLGIHSPSTVLRDLVGIYIPLGIAEGINEESDSVFSSIAKLNEGIKINAKDMAIDTTQYVNYGAISGEIQTQSKFNFGNIADQIYNAVISGMENSTVEVSINAKTEEGVIVKKAAEGFEDYVNRTGELPFPVPV